MAETSFDAVAGSLNSNAIGKWQNILIQANAGPTDYYFTIPVNATELLISVEGLQSGARMFTGTAICPISILEDSSLPHDLVLGGGIVSGYSGSYIDVYVNLNSSPHVHINNAIWIGTDYRPSATLKVYAR